MEFGRRLATERDLEKSDVFHLCNIGMCVKSKLPSVVVYFHIQFMF